MTAPICLRCGAPLTFGSEPDGDGWNPRIVWRAWCDAEADYGRDDRGRFPLHRVGVGETKLGAYVDLVEQEGWIE